jgi:hypothetical protein
VRISSDFVAWLIKQSLVVEEDGPEACEWWRQRAVPLAAQTDELESLVKALKMKLHAS